METTIRIACKGAETRELGELHEFQGGLKRLSEPDAKRLEKEIIELGFSEPLSVWVGQDGKSYILNGHQRLAVLKGMAERGCLVPPIPISVVDASDYREAKRKVLALTSQYGEITPEGMVEFLKEAEISLQEAMESFRFPEVDLAQLAEAGLVVTQDVVPEPAGEPVIEPGEMVELGRHRLLCGDAGKAEDVDRLLGGAKVQLVNTDPPYNVKVEPRSSTAIAAGLSSYPDLSGKQMHHQAFDVARGAVDPAKAQKKMRPKDRPLEGDFVSDEEFARMLRAWFGQMARVLEPGRAFYIWGGYANIGNYPPALKECELYFSQTIIWVKEHPVLTRKDFMGNHEWCQPGDTKVLTPDGSVPISSLRNGDGVVSYSRNHNVAVGVRQGLAVETTSRHYSGPLLGVCAGATTTWCTPGHLWSVRLAPSAGTYWCVYVMRRGEWWRVGKSKLLSTWGFGVKHRLKTEGGDEAWVLSVHPSNVEAAIAEQVILAEYGIPTTTWAESASSRRTIADVSRLYERLDLPRLHDNALRLLSDYGRLVDYPFLRANRTRDKIGRRVSLMFRACNLLPEVMMLPVHVDGIQTRWECLRAIEREPFEGDVFSMDVPRWGHYIADGLVTHNCFYGWREGAAHQFLGPPNVPDVWSVKKVCPQKMVHLTEKPVELAARAMRYSSRAGENVLDLFGGSGSTLIAAEQMGRRAFLMEIDRLYSDVIVRRYYGLVGWDKAPHEHKDRWQPKGEEMKDG